MMKSNRKKVLTTAVTALMTMAVCGNLPVANASDTEIYTKGQSGSGNIYLVLALDTSKSMDRDAGFEDNGACDVTNSYGTIDGNIAANEISYYGEDWIQATNSYRTYPFARKGCAYDKYFGYWTHQSGEEDGWYLCEETDKPIKSLADCKNAKKQRCDANSSCNAVERAYDRDVHFNRTAGSGWSGRAGYYVKYAKVFDRMSRLKMALYDFMGSSSLKDNVHLGIVTYTEDSAARKQGGVVKQEILALTDENKNKTRDTIKGLEAKSFTPIRGTYLKAGDMLFSYIKNNLNGNANSQCSAYGIYFLTDGQPDGGWDLNIKDETRAPDLYSLYGLKHIQTTYDKGRTDTKAGSDGASGWNYIGELAEALISGDNQYKVPIKTAVVGYGLVFENTPSAISVDAQGKRQYNCSAIPAYEGDAKYPGNSYDARNTCKWGAAGGGGYFYASDGKGVEDSIINFTNQLVREVAEKVGVNGAPSISSSNAFNPLELGKTAYYGSLKSSKLKLWLGNLNKYDINESKGTLVTSDSSRILDDNGSALENPKGTWGTDGFVGKLPTSRKVVTDTLSDSSATLDTVTLDNVKNKKITNSGYWARVLGYDVGIDGSGVYTGTWDGTKKIDMSTQSGAVMHSAAVTLPAWNGDKNEYVAFGTTDGIFHLLNGSTGQEIFAFVPNEFMNNAQKEAFKGPKAVLNTLPITDENGAVFTKNNEAKYQDQLYGVDGPWTVYADAENTTRTLYGGLRMGGRSYYALDVTDVNNPTLKFKIDPANSAVYNSTGKKTYEALKYMGQSWSKPTIARVKFPDANGTVTPRTVMIVGGGYDNRYEVGKTTDDFNDDLGNGKQARGVGVYMFDANTGELLWWGSGQKPCGFDEGPECAGDQRGGAPIYTNTWYMDFSVVSKINAIDRDGDGFVDNLYFGDLGGQGWRVDINNDISDNEAKGANKQGRFARVIRILDANNADEQVRPRFYEMPNLSVHRDGSIPFVAVAFASGNRTSPLSGTTGTDNRNANGKKSARDGVFVIYDKDAGKKELFQLKTKDDSSQSAYVNGSNVLIYSTKASEAEAKNKLILAVNGANDEVKYDSTTERITGGQLLNGVTVAGHKGWYYLFDNETGNTSTKAGAIKALNQLFSIDSYLFVNVYERDNDVTGSSTSTTTGTCGTSGKLAGSSYVYRFCLPTGACPVSDLDTRDHKKAPAKYFTGAGIAGATFGARGTVDGYKAIGLVSAGDNTNTPNFAIKPNIQVVRWYESRKNN